MRSYHNIEPKCYPGRRYRVAYATSSGIWHVYGKTGCYHALHSVAMHEAFTARTLGELSALLAER